MGTPQISPKLKERMEKIKLFEADIVEKFSKGGGNGGQKVNKTNSQVHLRYKCYNPVADHNFDISINHQGGRDREKNRIAAREILCGKIEKVIEEKSDAARAAANAALPVPPKVKKKKDKKRLDSKKRKGDKKKSRGKVRYRPDD